MLRSKYGAHKVKTEEGTFDSKKEYKRYLELKRQEEVGIIKNLGRQVKFLLIPAQKGKERNERSCSYKADFVYRKGSTLIVEDVKGVKTPEYIIKRKLMKQVYDIEIIEV